MVETLKKECHLMASAIGERRMGAFCKVPLELLTDNPGSPEVEKMKARAFGRILPIWLPGPIDRCHLRVPAFPHSKTSFQMSLVELISVRSDKVGWACGLEHSPDGSDSALGISEVTAPGEFITSGAR